MKRTCAALGGIGESGERGIFECSKGDAGVGTKRGLRVGWKFCYDLVHLTTGATVTGEELETLTCWANGLPII